MKKFLKTLATPFVWFYKHALYPAFKFISIPFRALNKKFQIKRNKLFKVIYIYYLG